MSEKNYMKEEYSDKFDELRRNRVDISYHKYGPAKKNFGEGLVNALESMELCMAKYEVTGNTEYLCDAANYLMFEFMFPKHPNTHFEATDSSGSAGISGVDYNHIFGSKKKGKFGQFL